MDWLIYTPFLKNERAGVFRMMKSRRILLFPVVIN
jgi:hypothetical protein